MPIDIDDEQQKNEPPVISNTKIYEVIECCSHAAIKTNQGVQKKSWSGSLSKQ